ncbi:MAG: general secretion pathway protein GspK, partial [Mesorhizobium sp.]
MNGDRGDDESASAGFSLVAVLVFMLIVSAIVVPFAVTAKTRLMIANNEVEQERLSLLAEGLVNVM